MANKSNVYCYTKSTFVNVSMNKLHYIMLLDILSVVK